eukprot:7391509-Prymnesium_polylepis.5
MEAVAIVARKSCHACRSAKAADSTLVQSSASTLRAKAGRKGVPAALGEKAGQTARDSAGHGYLSSYLAHAIAKLSGESWRAR